MRPEVATAVREVGGGPWLLSLDAARRTFQAVGRFRQPSGDGTLGQGKPGPGRFPEGRLVFGVPFAVQP